ncbi:MAG: arsenate reductase ArsC [Chloroflexi bacterium]|nr:arsenate reductase ArsC [Chloroflexota bacterium]
MAEGLARAAGIEAYSAGTTPAGYVHPLAVQVMAEIGIDISQQTSKAFDMSLAQSMDAMITVCGDAEEECPVIPGVRRLHWPIPDPAKATGTQEDLLNQFRTVRDGIARRANEFRLLIS